MMRTVLSDFRRVRQSFLLMTESENSFGVLSILPEYDIILMNEFEI